MDALDATMTYRYILQRHETSLVYRVDPCNSYERGRFL